MLVIFKREKFAVSGGVSCAHGGNKFETYFAPVGNLK